MPSSGYAKYVSVAQRISAIQLRAQNKCHDCEMVNQLAWIWYETENQSIANKLINFEIRQRLRVSSDSDSSALSSAFVAFLVLCEKWNCESLSFFLPILLPLPRAWQMWISWDEIINETTTRIVGKRWEACCMRSIVRSIAFFKCRAFYLCVVRLVLAPPYQLHRRRGSIPLYPIP